MRQAMRASQRNVRECFTTGIVSTVDEGCRIGLYFTGRKHTGENLADVLKHRAAGLEAPIQMCDALSVC